MAGAVGRVHWTSQMDGDECELLLTAQMDRAVVKMSRIVGVFLQTA